MEITKPKVNIKTSFLLDKEYSFEINLGHILIFLTLVYAVLFAGAIQPFNLTTLSDRQNLLSLFSIVSPSLICFCLHDTLSDKFLNFKISNLFVLKLLVTATFISAFTFIRFYTKSNLFSDEVYYAQNSHKLSWLLYDLVLKKVGLLYFRVPVSEILQAASVALWLVLIFAFYFAIKGVTKLRLVIVLLVVSIFRLFIPSMLGGASETHPPLNYLVANIISTLTGINDKSFMVSILAAFILFFSYLLYRIKISFPLFLCMVLSVLSIPLIGRWTYFYDQAIFAFFCFTIVSIEIYLEKVEPVYLFFFIAVCVLFRQSCIVAFLPATVHALYYFKKQGIPPFSKSAFLAIAPGFFALPTFFYALSIGTPTTPSLLGENAPAKISMLDKLFNLDLVAAFLPILNAYAFLIIFGILILLVRKKFLLVTSIALIYLGYITLHLIGEMPALEPKYFLEAYGFLLVLSLIMVFILIEQNAKKISIAVLITMLFLLYKETSWKIPYSPAITQENNLLFRKIHENHFSYIHEYIAAKKIYNRSVVLGIDYGFFPFILNGVNGANLNQAMISRRGYIGRKYDGTRKVSWLDVELSAIQYNDSLDYVFINDYLQVNSASKVDSLIAVYNWNVIMNMPVTETSTGCIGLSRYKF